VPGSTRERNNFRLQPPRATETFCGAFCFISVFTYLTTLGTITVISLAFGWRLGHCGKSCTEKLSPVAAGLMLAGGVLWILAARYARDYADTDGGGAEVAGWFAQSGKWFVLLGTVLFGHGWICGQRLTPAGAGMRIAYYVAVLGLFTLVISRTIPVYVFLGAGQRDESGILRQSKTVEVTCGAVALLNYLERFQHHAPLTEREVSQVCGVTPEGTTPAQLVAAAHHYGLTNAAAHVLTVSQLEHTPLPAIVSISTMPTVHHATLLVHLDPEKAVFIDPTYGLNQISRQRFQEIWYGKTIVLQ
jgi:hypothetical protein